MADQELDRTKGTPKDGAPLKAEGEKGLHVDGNPGNSRPGNRNDSIAAPTLSAADGIGASEAVNGFAVTADIADTIREKIVPSLLALSDAGVIPGARSLTPVVVEAVADAAVAGDLTRVQSHVHAHTAAGGSLAEALIHLIGGAAMRLGEDWEDDTRDFMDVTIGLGTLQAAILAVSDPGTGQSGGQRSVLLGATPGDDHTLGLAIVNHFFRQAGWSVTFMPYADAQELLSTVSNNWFAVAGLSVASEQRLDGARKMISGLRRVSCNPGLKVMVGGPLAKRDEKLAGRVGADVTVVDGERAPEWANRWVEGALGAGSSGV